MVPPERAKLLIVDDEPAIRDSLKLLLEEQYDVRTAADGEQALSLIQEIEPDLILMDVMMPRLDGVETLRRLQERSTRIPVIMLTAANTVRTAVDAMKSGAVDFLNKPFEVEDLKRTIAALLCRPEVRAHVTGTAEPTVSRQNLPKTGGDFGPMVGKSACMSALFEQVKNVAVRSTTVLITGESGTGKELVARQIHDLSPRRSGPFIAINCAAIPESLIESELFGHEKGAFTHAVDRRIGHFELADQGTLFLDEIGELSLGVQVKMLRFLQEQEFYRVGRSKPIRVDVRVVAATNKNLEELVKQKTFRQDLFYRINVINLALPPLRERFDDIEPLVHHFLRKLAPLYGGRALTFSAEAMDRLVQYEWPGNVRELENVLESLLAIAPEAEVGVDALPRKVRDRLASESEFVGKLAASSSLGFEAAERAFETEMISKALKKANYVQTRAAEMLGISRRILKYKMDKLGMSDRPPGEPEVTANAAREDDTPPH
jgi:DNA-binding NtrC family response regulator